MVMMIIDQNIGALADPRFREGGGAKSFRRIKEGKPVCLVVFV